MSAYTVQPYCKVLPSHLIKYTTGPKSLKSLPPNFLNTHYNINQQLIGFFIFAITFYTCLTLKCVDNSSIVMPIKLKYIEN